MLAAFIQDLAAKGRSCFSFADAEKLKSSTPMAIKAALRRLQKKGEIAMPYRGFYVIVPPEYRAAGCLPPEQFIPDLMDHLGEVYYVGLLSAAEYHGAAHQRPQVFQVVEEKTNGVASSLLTRSDPDGIPGTEVGTSVSNSITKKARRMGKLCLFCPLKPFFPQDCRHSCAPKPFLS